MTAELDDQRPAVSDMALLGTKNRGDVGSQVANTWG
jgi:hypothetical protein